MNDRKLKHLVDFEWATVARYMVYVSAVAGLKEINTDHVVSFPLARMGYSRLSSRLKRILSVLEGNVKALETFAGRFKGELTENELVVLRTIYVQHARSIETVKGHMKAVEHYRTVGANHILLEELGGGEDELF